MALTALITGWIEWKAAFIAWSGLDRGALQILGGVLFLLLLCRALGRPLASRTPLLWLFILVAGNEAATILRDGAVAHDELVAGLGDLLLVTLLPMLLFAVARFLPWMIFPLSPRPIAWSNRPNTSPRFAHRLDEAIDDAEFEDMEQDESGDWRVVRRAGVDRA